jgi:hypothetical protein
MYGPWKYDNRVNKALEITAELKVTSQVVYLQQVLPVLAYSDSSLKKTMSNYPSDMWWVVRIEINISASVGGFPINLRGQSRPFFITRTSRKEIVPSDSISIVNWMDGLRLLRWVRKFCIPSAP